MHLFEFQYSMAMTPIFENKKRAFTIGDNMKEYPNTVSSVFTVSLVEENRPVRNALSARLARYPEINLVESRPYLPTTPAEFMRFKPDVVLLGFPQMMVSHPESTHFHIQQLAKQNVAVIGLTPYVYITEKQSFLEAGGAALILKTIDTDRIVEAIKTYAPV